MRMWVQKWSASFRTVEMMRGAIEHHHQRFDGSGYPDGLKGEDIPLWARIIALYRRLREYGHRAVHLGRENA